MPVNAGHVLDTVQLMLLLKVHHDMRSTRSVYAVLSVAVIYCCWIAPHGHTFLCMSFIDCMFLCGCMYSKTHSEPLVYTELLVHTCATAAATA